MKKILGLGCALGICFTVPSLASKQLVVGPDDTVYGIAYNEGVLTRSIISANNLTPPYTLTPGQVLVIPAPNEHIAAHGETLKDIADARGVNVDVLAQENNFFPSYSVKQGDVLIIPSRDTESMSEVLMAPAPEIVSTSLEPLPLVAAAPLGAPVGVSASSGLPPEIAEELAREHESTAKKGAPVMGNLAEENKEEKKSEKEKKEEKAEKKAQEKQVAQKEEEIKEKVEVPAEVTFVWPVEGTVIQEFTAGTNEGINIQVEEGTPVKAAESGEVIYVGNEIKNMGNLILIKHDKGYVTAYSHLSEAVVKKGHKVKKGDKIAHSGASGGVEEPQLHFEIREGKKPINPMNKLQSGT